MDKKYMDIIDLDYKPSLKHPRMPRQNRASQFQAFKALRGYEERIYESSKEKIQKKLLASDQKDLINYRLSEIGSGKNKKNYKFIFFKRDDSLIYGKYENVCGKVKKIDSYEKIIYLEKGERINIEDLIAVEEL